jgi:hypothetical protein
MIKISKKYIVNQTVFDRMSTYGRIMPVGETL